MNIWQLLCWLLALVLAVVAALSVQPLTTRYNLPAAALAFFILGFIVTLFIH